MLNKTRKILAATKSTLPCVQAKTVLISFAWLRGILVLLEIPSDHLANFSSRYKHNQALKEHGESATFRKFQQDVSNQDLLLAPPSIHIVSQRGGFSSRL